MRYTNNKEYKIVTQVIPYENNVLKFEQLFKIVEDGYVFVKDLNKRIIK